MEGDARSSAECPVRGRTVRDDLVGQHVLKLRVVGQLDQRLVELLRACRPDGADAAVKRVERVGAAAAGEADVQVAARALRCVATRPSSVEAPDSLAEPASSRPPAATAAPPASAERRNVRRSNRRPARDPVSILSRCCAHGYDLLVFCVARMRSQRCWHTSLPLVFLRVRGIPVDGIGSVLHADSPMVLR